MISLEVYPIGVRPPSHLPVFDKASILSRTRSAVVSRSSWANTEAMYIIAFPMGVEVSKFSVAEINPTFFCSNNSRVLEKSETFLVIRSRR